MKRGVDRILDEEPWEAEIKIMIREGLDPDDARSATINRWMRNGDLRPFQAHIDKALCASGAMIALDRTIIDCLAECMTLGLLVPKPGRDGKSSAKFAWDYTAKLFYDRLIAADVSHKKAVQEVARRLHKSTGTVRKAVDNVRKRAKQ
jgi:hypothetical protein